jgi:uncharacterized SAM-binding protein YcdF (DUF218 family)
MKTGFLEKLLKGSCFIPVILLLNTCAFSPKVCQTLLKESLQKKYDMIVVPGVPFENGQWSAAMKGRVYWSKYLYDQGIALNIMYSGSAVYTPYIEADIMALYAEKLGIRKENIFTETLAEHSTENIYYGYKKARKLGFERIALASDPFQTKMLRRFTRKIVDPYVGLIPIVYDTLSVMESKMSDPEIDFQKAFVTGFKPLPERETFLERLKGTRGLDIDTSAYR